MLFYIASIKQISESLYPFYHFLSQIKIAIIIEEVKPSLFYFIQLYDGNEGNGLDKYSKIANMGKEMGESEGEERRR